MSSTLRTTLIISTIALGLLLLGIGFLVMNPDLGKADRERYHNNLKASLPIAPPPIAPPQKESESREILPKKMNAAVNDLFAPTTSPQSITDANTQITSIPFVIAKPPPPPPVPESLLRSTITVSEKDTNNDHITPIKTEIRVAPQRFLFNNQSVDALTGNPIVTGNKDPSSSVDPVHFAPEGTIIQLALVSNVISTDTEIPVSAAIWEPVYFQGRKLLDIGDRLIGKASAGKKRDRLIVTWQTVILKNGKSFKIEGIAQDTDGTYGISGKMVGNVLLNSLGPMLLSAVTSFGSTLQQRVLVGSGASSQDNFNTASGGVQVTPTASNAGISSAQGALDKINQLLAQDVEDNKPYLVLIAGQRCRAYLTKWLDTSNPLYGQ